MDARVWRVFASLGIPGVALGVFYALYRGLGFTFSPVPASWTGPIVVLFLLVVGGITFFALERYAPDRKPPQRLDDVLSLYETLRAGLASPIQNVEQIRRIANSTDPNRQRYLREFSNLQAASFLEVEAIREALKALEQGERVQDLFKRVSSAEKERIAAMIPATDDPCLVRIRCPTQAVAEALVRDASARRRISYPDRPGSFSATRMFERR